MDTVNNVVRYYGYIYVTVNLINNKKYIGKHKASRFEPDRYLGSGKILKQALEKEGKENFKCFLIEWCKDLKELNEREAYWTNYLNVVNNSEFYNLVEGGSGGNLYSQLSLEAKLDRNSRISESLKETFSQVDDLFYINRANKKRATLSKLSEEEKEKRRKINSDAQILVEKNRTEEEKRLISEKHKHTLSLKTEEEKKLRLEKERITKSQWTKEFKDEYHKKLSEGNLGKKRYTNGVITISCLPGQEPEGFYLGGANKNKYKWIYIYDNFEFKGKPELIEYLKKKGYEINSANIDSILNKTKRARLKFSDLIEKIVKVERSK